MSAQSCTEKEVSLSSQDSELLVVHGLVEWLISSDSKTGNSDPVHSTSFCDSKQGSQVQRQTCDWLSVASRDFVSSDIPSSCEDPLE